MPLLRDGVCLKLGSICALPFAWNMLLHSWFLMLPSVINVLKLCLDCLLLIACVYTVYAFLRDVRVFQWSKSECGGRESQRTQVCVGRSQWCLESGQHGLHLRAGPNWWVTLMWLFQRCSLDCYDYPLVISLYVFQQAKMKTSKLEVCLAALTSNVGRRW